MYICPPHLPCLHHPLWIVIWKSGCPCVGLWLCLNNPTSVPTPWLECAHASVHVYMSTWLPMSGAPLLHSYMQTQVSLCVCSNQTPSSSTPSLACVLASVHVFMSIWLPILGSSPLQSYIETWVSLCTTVCVYQSSHFWYHTLVRMCTCISTCIYVHLTSNITSNSYA